MNRDECSAFLYREVRTQVTHWPPRTCGGRKGQQGHPTRTTSGSEAFYGGIVGVRTWSFSIVSFVRWTASAVVVDGLED